jgi:hypothetical protein
MLENSGPTDGPQIVLNTLMAHAVAIAALGYPNRDGVRKYLARLLEFRLSRVPPITITAEPMGRG